MEIEVSAELGKQKWRNAVHHKSCCLKMCRDTYQEGRALTQPVLGSVGHFEPFALMAQTAPSTEAVSVGIFWGQFSKLHFQGNYKDMSVPCWKGPSRPSVPNLLFSGGNNMTQSEEVTQLMSNWWFRSGQGPAEMWVLWTATRVLSPDLQGPAFSLSRGTGDMSILRSTVLVLLV